MRVVVSLGLVLSISTNPPSPLAWDCYTAIGKAMQAIACLSSSRSNRSQEPRIMPSRVAFLFHPPGLRACVFGEVIGETESSVENARKHTHGLLDSVGHSDNQQGCLCGLCTLHYV
ncbi:hypothetical protein RB213_013457 [Colletotrichum asianum]